MDNWFLKKKEKRCVVERRVSMCVACNDLCIWNLDINQSLERRLAAAQRNIERAMIGVSWQNHRKNEWIRRKTKVRDIIHVIKARKWTWAGHISRLQDDRWTSQVTDWRPMDGSRPRGRPLKRWEGWYRWLLEICLMEAECPRQIVMEKECWGLHPTSRLKMA